MTSDALNSFNCRLEHVPSILRTGIKLNIVEVRKDEFSAAGNFDWIRTCCEYGFKSRQHENLLLMPDYARKLNFFRRRFHMQHLNRNQSQKQRRKQVRAAAVAVCTPAPLLVMKSWSKNSPLWVKLLWEQSRVHRHRQPWNLNVVYASSINNSSKSSVRVNVFANAYRATNAIPNRQEKHKQILHTHLNGRECLMRSPFGLCFYRAKFKNICKNGKYKLLERTKQRLGHCNFYNDFFLLLSLLLLVVYAVWRLLLFLLSRFLA